MAFSLANEGVIHPPRRSEIPMWLISLMFDSCVNFWSADSAEEAGMIMQQNVQGAFMLFGAVFLIWGAIVTLMNKPPAIVHKVAAAFAVLAFIIGTVPPLIPIAILGAVGYTSWRLYRWQQRPPPARAPRRS